MNIMPQLDDYRGYRIFTAISAGDLTAVSSAYRVKKPDGSDLAGGPFPTMAEVHQAIDSDITPAHKNSDG